MTGPATTYSAKRETRAYPRWLGLFAFAAISAAGAWGQDSVRGKVVNPHGSLDVPCENCHTTTAWKPVRKQPEFNHDRQTGFPLLGQHSAVACKDCHVSLVFSKAPTRCAECHADLHRRQFGANCQECHTVRGWKVAVSAIQDHNNRFPLLGAHAAAVCDDCHRGAAAGVYTGLSTQCVTCHLRDFQNAAPLNHVAANLPTTCETCHTVNSWQPARFNHAQVTGFALTGAHTSLACVQCHVGNRFAGTPANCLGCHATDFNGTTNPNHVTAGFPTDCGLCHTTLTWSGATFNHNTFTSFPLTGAHTTVACAQCHVGGKFVGTPTACEGCHLQDYANTTNPNHRASNFPTTCATCHNTTSWQNATFDHSTTGFALTGAHLNVACSQCHVNNNYNLQLQAGSNCSSCHLTDYNGTTDPPHKSANFPLACDGCHTTTSWSGATFNHTTTGFTLTGAHTSLQCAQCHVNNNYSFTNAACINCHLTDFNGTTNPNHVQAAFPQDCSLCHTTTNWLGASFNHNNTGFALTGAHTTVQCAQCHVNNNYNLTSGACINCHLTDYNGATNPPHQASGFPQDCTLCHTTTNWTSATFNHSTTGFTLTGAHTSLQCAQCHVNNNYSLTSAACINCHLTDYNGTNNPPHKSANFPQDCSGCHTTTDWSGATFNHATTGFALVGAHTALQCAQCHVNNNYTFTNAACINCHLTDYNNTNNPPHKSANFPQDCTQCHTNMNDWSGATFNHASTGFALVGVHATQQCTACHVNNNYTLTSGACWNCHQTDYNGATNPPHAAAGFPQDCTLCHGTAILNWTSATFNHATTGFALTGAHTNLQCAQCHVNSNYSLTSGACWNCHQADYNGTTNPPHAASGFPQDCSGCHTTTDWSGATFNHATTGFTLTGAHTSLQCNQCHVNNNFTLNSAACWNCHQADYNGTTNPSHSAAGFPQDCSTCHSTTNWSGATFTHPTTPLQLTGYHATMLTNNQCGLCHVGNNYTSTPSDCWSCHQTDYNNTTNPSHVAAGFAQTCNSCHTFVDWTGAKYTAHDSAYFPIYSGTHQGKWTQCSDCHTNSSNFAVFTCIACHQHSNQAQVTAQHQGVRGFVYNGTSCYSCHPKGTH